MLWNYFFNPLREKGQNMNLHYIFYNYMDFPGGSDVKVSVYNVGDLGSILEWGRFLGERNGNPLQYSCLENPMGGGAWCPRGRKESDMGHH